LHDADAHHAADATPDGGNGVARGVGRGQGTAGFDDQRRARIGELHAVRGALEQPRTEFTFQALDRHRQRGLDEVDAGCRPREALFLGDREEVLQMPKFHVLLRTSCTKSMTEMKCLRSTA